MSHDGSFLRWCIQQQGAARCLRRAAVRQSGLNALRLEFSPRLLPGPGGDAAVRARGQAETQQQHCRRHCEVPVMHTGQTGPGWVHSEGITDHPVF